MMNGWRSVARRLPSAAPVVELPAGPAPIFSAGLSDIICHTSCPALTRTLCNVRTNQDLSTDSTHSLAQSQDGTSTKRRSLTKAQTGHASPTTCPSEVIATRRATNYRNRLTVVVTEAPKSLTENDSREASSTGSNSASFSWFSCEMAARTCFLLSQK